MDYNSLYCSFYEVITGVKKVVIIPHKNPDGDSIGASLALYSILKGAGKDVAIVTPNKYPESFVWLPNSYSTTDFEKETIRATEIIQMAELLIFVDFNSITRLEKLADLINSLTIKKMMVDHHPYPQDIADVMISNTAVSSTCELLFDTIRNTPLLEFCTKESAECFYTGIMTDTAALNHNSSRMETYDIVGQLLQYGIDKEKIHRLIFHNNEIERFRLIGYVYSEKLDVISDCQAAIIALSLDDLERFNYSNGDTEGFSNLPLSIKDINMAIFILEKSDRVKISFRSRGDVAVNHFAAQLFNGGGHKHAAGAESRLPYNEVVALIKEQLPLFYSNKL